MPRARSALAWACQRCAGFHGALPWPPGKGVLPLHCALQARHPSAGPIHRPLMALSLSDHDGAFRDNLSCTPLVAAMSAACVPGKAFGRSRLRRSYYEGTPLHRRDELTVRGQGLLKQFDHQRIFANFLPLGSRRARSARMPRPSLGGRGCKVVKSPHDPFPRDGWR
jgi:hypothetical protein